MLKKSKMRAFSLLGFLLALCLSLGACIGPVEPAGDISHTSSEQTSSVILAPDGFDLSAIPPYSGQPYVQLNQNMPYFTADEIVSVAYESYGELDGLGRCTQAIACLGTELMPTEERGSISSVKPTGWHSVEYDCVSGGDLYNRCHLIGFQLAGENANRQNLVTGTTDLNHDGMLPFENMIADYIKETGNHVMYRVTPIFVGDELVCRGILMEAYSVEDAGDGICFNVYCYNNQPGVEIDYATGNSWLTGETPVTDAATEERGNAPENATYTVKVSTKKYHKLSHYPELSANMEYTTLTKSDLEAQGYSPCGICKP